jgi:hypothetical protein
LIKRFPDFYTAAPESVRERVALRYLEECASRGIVEAKNSSGGAVDISQSIEEFLCKNLTGVHESNPFPVSSVGQCHACITTSTILQRATISFFCIVPRRSPNRTVEFFFFF